MILFCLLRSSISLIWLCCFRLIDWMYSAAFFRIWARLAWNMAEPISFSQLGCVFKLSTFSPWRDGTASRKLVKLSLMWSLRFRSRALWCARFSAWECEPCGIRPGRPESESSYRNRIGSLSGHKLRFYNCDFPVCLLTLSSYISRSESMS